MSGVDIAVLGTTDVELVRAAVARALGVHPARLSPSGQSGPADTIYVDIIAAQSGTHTLVATYSDLPGLPSRLAADLGLNLLTGESRSIDPYVWWLVTPAGEQREVGIEPRDDDAMILEESL
jgi:hypothetical protein